MAVLRQRSTASGFIIPRTQTVSTGCSYEALPPYEQQDPFSESHDCDNSKDATFKYHTFQPREGQYSCDIIPSEPAVWVSKSTGQRLSIHAVAELEDSGSIRRDDLETFDPAKHVKNSSYRDPISGLLITTYGTVTEVLSAVSKSTSPFSSMTRIFGAALTAPRDFTMALTEGFHNAPKLYGDDTVREAPKVVGFQSGIAAAGKGLGVGLYDGLSGFVMQPIRGARNDGPVGLLKGVGKGVGGLVCKPCGGACSVPGYALKGIHLEVNRRWKVRGRLARRKG